MKSVLPLLDRYAPESTVTWCDGRPVTAQVFCGAAAAVGSRLPPGPHAINLCEQAPNFLLTAAAAWMRGHTLVLPADRLAHTLDQLHGDFPDAYCLCDTQETADVVRARGFPVVDAAGAFDAPPLWPPPGIPATLVAACLHTSGSTGIPTRHVKSWAELVAGAATLAQAFGVPPASAALLGSVAPQHMFGFETTILFTLQSGSPLLPLRPALPSDLSNALHFAHALGRTDIWLFTTPLQLRAFHAVPRLDGLARVVTATMPLEPSLAQAIERDWAVPVEEIYGCTEGGMLAYRRPAQTEDFTAGSGIRFAVDAQGHTIVAGGHLSAPLPLSDHIEVVAEGTTTSAQRIRFLGRDDDLVKIAGKRASLAGLTSILQSLPGIDDGVFFLPAPTARRLCAAVVAPRLSAARVQSALAAVIDPAFLPRPLLFVDEIPRGAAHKASLASLREIAARMAEGRNEPAPQPSRMVLPAGDPVFAGHFPDRPIVPGVLILAHVQAQLARRGLRLCELRSAKFHATTGPGEVLEFHVTHSGRDVARFEVFRDSTLVADGACRVEHLAGT